MHFCLLLFFFVWLRLRFQFHSAADLASVHVYFSRFSWCQSHLAMLFSGQICDLILHYPLWTLLFLTHATLLSSLSSHLLSWHHTDMCRLEQPQLAGTGQTQSSFTHDHPYGLPDGQNTEVTSESIHKVHSCDHTKSQHRRIETWKGLCCRKSHVMNVTGPNELCSSLCSHKCPISGKHNRKVMQTSAKLNRSQHQAEISDMESK